MSATAGVAFAWVSPALQLIATKLASVVAASPVVVEPIASSLELVAPSAFGRREAESS